MRDNTIVLVFFSIKPCLAEIYFYWQNPNTDKVTVINVSCETVMRMFRSHFVLMLKVERAYASIMC